MAKPDHIFTCQACGAIWPKWAGKCEACGEWNTLVEEAARAVVPGALAAPTGKKGKALAFVELTGECDPPQRIATGISEFDRVCGGGLVPASAILIGGDPGVGKSTLLLQAAAALARRGAASVYVTGEEAEAQVQERARRLRRRDAPVKLAAETDLRKILEGLKTLEARRRRSWTRSKRCGPTAWRQRPARSRKCAPARTNSCASPRKPARW